MEKLGVDVDPVAVKTAAEESKPTCPQCGQTLLSNVNVPTCPTHGTKPFEPSRAR